MYFDQQRSERSPKIMDILSPTSYLMYTVRTYEKSLWPHVGKNPPCQSFIRLFQNRFWTSSCCLEWLVICSFSVNEASLVAIGYLTFIRKFAILLYYNERKCCGLCWLVVGCCSCASGVSRKNNRLGECDFTYVYMFM